MNSKLLAILSVAVLTLSVFTVCLAAPADADDGGDDAKPTLVDNLAGYGDDKMLEEGMKIIYHFTEGSQKLTYTVYLKDESVGGFIGEISETTSKNVQKHVAVLDTVLGFDIRNSSAYPTGVTVTKNAASVSVTGSYSKTVGIYNTSFALDLKFEFSSEDLSSPELAVVSTEGTYRMYGTHMMGRILESSELEEGTAVAGEACTFSSTTTHTSYNQFIEPSYGRIFSSIHLNPFPLTKSDVEWYATVTATGNTKMFSGLECQEFTVANGSGTTKGTLYAHNNETIAYNGTWKGFDSTYQVQQLVPGNPGGGGEQKTPCIVENLSGYGDDKMLEAGMKIVYSYKDGNDEITDTVNLRYETLDGFLGEVSRTTKGNIQFILPNTLENILGFDITNPGTYPRDVVVKENATVTVKGTYTATVGWFNTEFTVDLKFTFSSEDLSSPELAIVSTEGTYRMFGAHYQAGILESTESNEGTAVAGEPCEFAYVKTNTRTNMALDHTYSDIFFVLHCPFPLTKGDIEKDATVTPTSNTRMFSNLECQEYTADNRSNIKGTFYAHNEEVIAYNGTFYTLSDFTVKAYVPGGDHTVVIDKGYPATCETTGLTEGQHCSTCGKVLVKQRVIPVIPSVPVNEEGKTFTAELGEATYLSADSVSYMTSKAASDSAYTLEIKSAEGVLKIDNTALRNLVAGDADVIIEKIPAPSGVPTDAVAFEIAVGDTHDLKGGHVTVTVPYDGPTDNVKVCCVVDGKVTEKFDVSFADGKAEFSVPHLSTFAIMKDSPDGNAGSDMTLLIVIGVIAAVALIGAAVFVMRSRSA